MRDSVVVLDGYTGFTPVQYRLLEQMLLCCRDVKLCGHRGAGGKAL